MELFDAFIELKKEIEINLKSLSVNIAEPDYYKPKKRGKYIFFFGPGTGIVLFPHPEISEEICYSFLTVESEDGMDSYTDYYILRETWEDEWRISPFLEGDLKCLLAVKEYLEKFSTKKLMDVCITGSNHKTYGYYLPWTNSKKMAYDRT